MADDRRFVVNHCLSKIQNRNSQGWGVGALTRPVRRCPPFIRATATIPALNDWLMTFVLRVLKPSCLTLKSRKHDPEAEIEIHRISCITCDAD